MFENIIGLFVYNPGIFNLHEIVFLYDFFDNAYTKIPYIIIESIYWLIYFVIYILIWLLFIKTWKEIRNYLHINNTNLKDKVYLIPISLLFWIAYPVFSFFFWLYWGKIDKRTITYLLLSNFIVSTLLLLLMLWINNYL